MTEPRPELTLDDPVVALHEYSADTTLQRTVPSSRGRLRATDVQRLWLEAAEQHRARGRLPDDEASVLEPWDEVLTLLERDPASAADRVDWVAKLAVIERLVERNGLCWDDPRVTAADLAYHDVRLERSVYGRLLSAGLMRSLVDADTVERLRTSPPATTRAFTRGTLINLIRRCGFHYEVNWTTCQFNAGTIRVEVQLDDPLATGTPDADDVIARLRGVLDGRPPRFSLEAANGTPEAEPDRQTAGDGAGQGADDGTRGVGDDAGSPPDDGGLWASVAG